MLWQDSIGSNPKNVLAGEQLREMDRSSYSDSCISPCGRISEEGLIGIH